MIDVRLGRSKSQFIQSILLFITNEQDESSFPSSAHKPSSMEFRLGRSIIDSFKSFKYLISLLIKNDRMYHCPIQWNSNEEDLFINNIISIIPLITNEQ